MLPPPPARRGEPAGRVFVSSIEVRHPVAKAGGAGLENLRMQAVSFGVGFFPQGPRPFRIVPGSKRGTTGGRGSFLAWVAVRAPADGRGPRVTRGQGIRDATDGQARHGRLLEPVRVRIAVWACDGLGR